ncbi:MAG: hypothetical protein KatS3mg003_0653 [Candidatus Nitrosocaldaceae archaeon]|nr:MAG: hypothetical protein KatS3mg003_0653 [Candidatus Nitrosocaldaceae archaeon]
MDPLNLKNSRLDIKKDEKDIEGLVSRLESLEKENRELRSRLYKLQYRGSFLISIILTSLGGVSLLSAYAYNSLVLTFIGLGLVLFGSVIFYALPNRSIPVKSLHSTISIIRSLSSILNNLGYKGRAIFLYPTTLSGLANGYTFIPKDSNILPSEDRLNREEFFHNNGLLIPAHAQSMVKLLEDSLDTNLLTLELPELIAKVEQFFIEDLRIIDNITFDIKDDMITVKIDSKEMADICRKVNSFDDNHLGCIICSSLALMISKVTGIPVVIEESRASVEKIKTTYKLLENGS